MIKLGYGFDIAVEKVNNKPAKVEGLMEAGSCLPGVRSVGSSVAASFEIKRQREN
ncbi:MAG: hypothetical protein MUW56_00450 [Chryseobacterium sp.]|uniref:hypothetical protein n=1 Tax=Chryseobacterium sp. TaxID=1871047 RepID=UPI0025BE9EA4|nr:hypothetical protein [Chryseobacterium sp.]MCJ7932131.1 hypothetical protein [Chryseobacterium sp.]